MQEKILKCAKNALENQKILDELEGELSKILDEVKTYRLELNEVDGKVKLNMRVMGAVSGITPEQMQEISDLIGSEKSLFVGKDYGVYELHFILKNS